MCGIWFGTGLPYWALPIVGIIPLLFFTFIAYGIYKLLFSPAHCQIAITDTPKDILNRRYANGELSTEDYQRMKTELS